MGTVSFTVIGVFSVELLAYQVSTACVADWARYLYLYTRYNIGLSKTDKSSVEALRYCKTTVKLMLKVHARPGLLFGPEPSETPSTSQHRIGVPEDPIYF